MDLPRPNPPEPGMVRLSQQVFKLLLSAYPDVYQGARLKRVTRNFRRRCRDAWRQWGLVGLLLVWYETLPDLVVGAPRFGMPGLLDV